MARLSLNDLNNFSTGGGNKNSFFSLKNDKDQAQVRIMLDEVEDLEDGFMYSCHEVMLNGKRRQVECLREYNDPISKCPFCENNVKLAPKIYIPLFNEETEEVQIWERGKAFMDNFIGFCSRYSNPSIVSHLVTIERHGKPKDMQTTYQLYEDGKDDTRLEDLPERPKVAGGIVLQKSADDMNYYLDSGEFPPADEEGDNTPPRRRREPQNDNVDEEYTPRRRTPANRSRNEF